METHRNQTMSDHPPPPSHREAVDSTYTAPTEADSQWNSYRLTLSRCTIFWKERKMGGDIKIVYIKGDVDLSTCTEVDDALRNDKDRQEAYESAKKMLVSTELCEWLKHNHSAYTHLS